MTTDQRLFLRPTDGDGDAAADCDIGAFEADGLAPIENELEVTLSGAPGGGAVTSVPGGIDCPADCVESYLFTTEVELLAEAAPGHLFVGWSGDCSGAGDCSVAMSVDRAVIATFAALFDLDVTLSGIGSGSVTSDVAGIACPGDCSEPFVDGTTVQLAAMAAPGSSFSGWSGDCTGMTCTLEMTADRSVAALFDLLPEIFDDGFESGDVCGWSSAQSAPPCFP